MSRLILMTGVAINISLASSLPVGLLRNDRETYEVANIGTIERTRNGKAKDPRNNDYRSQKRGK